MVIIWTTNNWSVFSPIFKKTRIHECSMISSASFSMIKISQFMTKKCRVFLPWKLKHLPPLWNVVKSVITIKMITICIKAYPVTINRFMSPLKNKIPMSWRRSLTSKPTPSIWVIWITWRVLNLHFGPLSNRLYKQHVPRHQNHPKHFWKSQNHMNLTSYFKILDPS